MLPHLPAALTTLLSLASIAAAIPANVGRLHGIEPRDTDRKCGNDLTPEAVSAKEQAFASLVAESKASNTLAAGNFTVPVNFNVIYASTNITDGYVPYVALPIPSCSFPLTPIIEIPRSRLRSML